MNEKQMVEALPLAAAGNASISDTQVNSIRFYLPGGVEFIRAEPDGRVFVQGELVDTSAAIYAGLRVWIGAMTNMQAIQQAVAGERERCAAIADEVGGRGYSDQGYEIAARIRGGK